MQQAVKTYQSRLADNERDSLILDNIEYVRHILGKLVHGLPDHIDSENLEAAGILGLVEAAHRYDKERAVAFTTYAYPRIRGAILDELRRNCPIPQKLLEKVAVVQRLCESLPSPVTPEDLMEHSELTMSEVEKCLQAMRISRFASWHDSIADVNGLSNRRISAPEEAAEHAEMVQVLADCIQKLPRDEAMVITLYHMEDLRMKEIGRVMGLSESRVSRLVSTAEFRLGEQLACGGDI